MKKSVFLFLIVIIPCLCFPAPNTAEADTSDHPKVLDIYLQCAHCDLDYFKKNLNMLNFSNDAATTDIHIISSSLLTGNGGSKYLMEFIGKGRFNTVKDTLGFIVDANLTTTESRDILLEKFKLGLVPYLSKTPFANKMMLSFDDYTVDDNIEKTDPWKNWVFSAGLLASAGKEKSYSGFDLSSNFYAGKITRDTKIEISSFLWQSKAEYRIYDNEQLIDCYSSSTKSFSLAGLGVKSIGRHFGIGALLNTGNSSYSNLKQRLSLQAAIEYSLFKYEDASRRQLVFLYAAGYEFSKYEMPTIYGRSQDKLLKHSLNAGFKIIERFGNIDATVQCSNYLNNFSCIDLSGHFNANIKVCKGLFLSANCTLEMLRNQISLSGGEMSTEELISSQHETQTDYRVRFGIGFSFTFGSKYSNAVNPRFSFY